MQARVACRTESNQVLFGIIAGLAAKLPVMHFKVGHGSTRLASPVHLGAAHDCEAVGTAWGLAAGGDVSGAHPLTALPQLHVLGRIVSRRRYRHSLIFRVRSIYGKVRNLGGEVLEKQAKITSKGQITVPREVRRVLGVRPGDRLLFEGDEKGVRVRPVRTQSPFAKFKGIGNPGIGSGRKGIVRWVRELRGR